MFLAVTRDAQAGDLETAVMTSGIVSISDGDVFWPSRLANIVIPNILHHDKKALASVLGDLSSTSLGLRTAANQPYQRLLLGSW